MAKRERPRKLTSLAELKAVSHPTRLRLFYAMKALGAMTATQLGELVDESPASVSYHLRQLAASGFIEESQNETGDGRQRWWRPTAQGFSWSRNDFGGSPAGTATAEAAKAAMLEHQWTRLSEYERTVSSWSPEWVEAAFSADNVMTLTADQTAAMYRELNEVVERFKAAGPESASTDATATVMVLLHGFPTEM